MLALEKMFKTVMAQLRGFSGTAKLLIAAIMVILSKLMGMTQVATFLSDLPESERDDFFAEVFDAAIGNEPNALVNKVGMFEGDFLESISDGMKGAALAYFNKTVPQVTA